MINFFSPTALKSAPVKKIVVKAGFVALGCLAASFPKPAWADDGNTVEFLQIAPVSLNTYVLESQVRTMERVAKRAAEDFFADNRACKVSFRSNALNGIDVVRSLRQAGFQGKICIPSNRFLTEDTRIALEAGADMILPKPMSRAQFLKLILASSV